MEVVAMRHAVVVGLRDRKVVGKFDLLIPSILDTASCVRLSTQDGDYVSLQAQNVFFPITELIRVLALIFPEILIRSRFIFIYELQII